ncbi:MAG: YihY/virulence factor BrkB family protein [Lachnospiraceae bacterium]|nr:YihY/virulence factor BrkB family protein [Lachnospiraceae bacterium]
MKKQNFREFYIRLTKINQIIQKSFIRSSVSSHAGESAFFLMLSFFPFTMFLLTLLRYTPLTEEMLVSLLQIIFPESFENYINNLIGEIYHTAAAGTILPVSIIIAIWLGSKSFLSLIRGLNDVYQIRESRSIVLVRILAFVYTLLFALILLATLTVLVFGNTLYYHIRKAFPFLEDTLLSIISLRSLVGFLLMLLFFLFLYHIIPNRKDSLKNQFPGALLATTGWILFSYVYSYYVDHLSNYSFFYGTMTTIALLMVWLYSCMYLLFLGGLCNYLLSQRSRMMTPPN